MLEKAGSILEVPSMDVDRFFGPVRGHSGERGCEFCLDLSRDFLRMTRRHAHHRLFATPNTFPKRLREGHTSLPDSYVMRRSGEGQGLAPSLFDHVVLSRVALPLGYVIAGCGSLCTT